MGGGIKRFDRVAAEQQFARQNAAHERLRRQVALAVERSSEMGNGMVLFSQGDWWAVKIALDECNRHKKGTT